MTFADVTRHQFVHLLRSRAARHPDRSAIQFLLDGETIGLDMSYAELDRRARRMAAYLQRHAGMGERALLLYPTGPDYVVAFFGCLYAGIIAVPAYPPELAHPQHLKRLLAMLDDAAPRLVLTDSAALPALQRLLPADGALMLATDEVPADCHEDQWQPAPVVPATIAFLQYTSGSTATPKGVMVSHRNLIGNEVALAAAYGVREGQDKWVSWLPLYHDMGLICALLQPLYSGITLVLMSPRHFLERPLRWLKAISEHGATISGGPDFSYRLCLERIAASAAGALDLSTWRLAFNGAEPVRAGTFGDFAAKFAAAGFGADALYPCYGLAEATVFVSGGQRGAGMVATCFDAPGLARGEVLVREDGTSLVACGMVWTGHRVEIVDPATAAKCAPGRIGEIWVQGESVAEGYWQNAGATEATFGARLQGDGQAWMRTGDLGFWHDGQLYIAGRLKDLIIVRGQNLYPQDVEQTIEAAVPEVRKGRVAAFPVEIDGAEGIGVAAELPRAVLKKLDAPALFRAIHRAVALEHQEPAGVILLLPPGQLPKTSSGKLQRSACRAGWLGGSLPVAAAFRGDRDWLLGADYAAPRDPAEERMAACWRAVLAVPQVGIHDNFFELGGDSLAAVRLVSRLRKELGVEVTPRTLFEAPTVARLTQRLSGPAALEGAAPGLLAPVAGSRPVALSFAQQRLWFLQQMAPDSAAYNLAATMRLSGALNVGALRAAFNALQARHEALRTTFHAKAGEPEQVIAPAAAVDLPLCELPAGDVHALLRVEAARPFDLAKGPLLRTRLIKLGEREHALLLVVHHIVFDGWSMRVLLRDLAAEYDARAAGGGAALAPLPIQYADYAAWQRQLLAADGARQLAYWKAQLGEQQPLLALPADRSRPAVPSQRGARHDVRLPAALTAQLHQVSRAHGATLFMTLLGAFGVLLHRLSGQDDIRIGVPVAGRNRLELEDLIGCFVNTQVLRTRIDARQDFAALLRAVREAALGAQAHAELPFDQLVEALQPQRSLSHPPLCQAKFVLQQPWTDTAALAGLAVTVDRVDEGASRFDLALDVTETGGELACTFNYATDLFDAVTIARWARHWESLLGALVHAPATPVGQLALLDDTASLALQQAWQGPLHDAPFEAVSARIAAQARRRPDAIALVAGGRSLRYSDLERQSNRLAHYLAAHGVGTEDRVAVCLPRSAELIVSIVAVLKTGAAYVPLDPAWPAERRQYQLADSGAAPTIDATLLAAVAVGGYPDAPLAAAAAVLPRHAAYVIYTSGSTGQPKGVLVEHGALANYVAAVSAQMPLGVIKSMALVSTVAADLGHTVLFGALANGCTLHLVDEECGFDPDRFGHYMAEHSIDALKIVPSHLAGLLQAAAPQQVLPRRCLLLGGEATSWSLVDTISRLAPGCQLINHYGPTETTVGVLVHPYHPSRRAAGATLPLGRPLANNRVCVLDAALNPAPVGVAGELYIGGAQLARGYLGRPGLTAERFIPDPFGPAGARLYRSGDSARMLADGTIEYIGRRDDQIKLRGYRVEPGEVAAQIRAEEGVADAAVLLDETGEAARLVAYVAAPPAFDLARLKERLARRLPDYLVPASMVRLDALPLTANGKLDRAALPRSEAAQTHFVAPAAGTEATLAAIWQEVLKLEQVGVHDNFFALGGDSILSLRIIARARAEGLKLAPKQMFALQTIAELAQALDGTAAPRNAPAPASAPIPCTPRGGKLPLSFAQQRLWFLHRMEPGSAAYNVPALLRLSGILDATALRRAFDALVVRHAILRTTFKEVDGVAVQEIGAHTSVAIEHPDLSGLAPELQRDELERHARADAARPFDLARGPLLRLMLVKLSDCEHVLLLSLHHIVCDGWSLGILLRELSALYGALCDGAPAALPPLPLQYGDFAAWQRGIDGAVLERELAYWKGQLGGEQPVLELPTDRARPAVARADGQRHRFALDAQLTAQLRTLARAQGASLFMTMKAAFDALLFRLTGQHDIRVGVPITNRSRVELEGLIGLFVNTQVLRCVVDARQRFDSLLKAVKETALAAQAHAELPFEQLVEALQPERDLSRSPLSQVMFNLQRPDFDAVDKVGELAMQADARDNGTAQFDFSLDIRERDADLEGWITYRTDLFDAATIERIGSYYLALLRAFAASPDLALGDAPMLPAAEQEAVTRGWNDTAAAYAKALPVHQLFAIQADATPDAVALICGGQALRYQELERAANRLAHRLIASGVARDSLVGVCAERSVDMVVGLLAILKSGAAYVPLDPDHPPGRLAGMVDDAGIKVLLVQGPLWARLDVASAARVLPFDQDGDADWPSTAPEVEVLPQQLAYTIYTSGSTGKPKGAGVPHAGLTNRLLWMQQAYGLGAHDRVLQKTPFGFDVSVWEFFWPLMCGATLVMASPGQHKDPAALAELIERHAITTVHFVPSMLQAFVEYGALPRCTSLARVLASGEALPADLAARFLRQSGAALHNLYGPTEASIDVSAWTCGAHDAAAVPIGRPIANTQLYVLDGHMNALPVGVRGELYIGGVQLARGYHARAGLTAERFVPDPFGPPGARLYRTGDVARWRADGALDYLGRTDHQVKIRGVRIELGEIEARLLAHPAVGEAVAVARTGEGTDARVVAYVVAKGSVTSEELRTHLRESLPEAMVPAAVVLLEAMPLNANGKLDRKLLPAPDFGAAADIYQAPAGAVEAALAQVWSEVLRIDRIGMHDNFFSLGGDSILALQVVSRARQAGLALTPRDLFQYQTVATLARCAGRVGTEAPQGPAHGEVALTPIQSWFLQQEQPQAHHWNQAVLLRAVRPLDGARLQAALEALVRQHDSLRLRFARDEQGTWRQWYGEHAPSITLRSRELAPEQLIDACSAIQASLDLEHGPLLAAAHLRLGPGEERLLLAIHHLVVDGVSWRVLLEDLQSAYDQLDAGVPVQLPARTSSYQDWAACLNAYPAQDELAYWTAALQPMVLPAANPFGENFAGGAERLDISLSPQRTGQLLQQANSAYRTGVNDLLVAALAQALCGWSGAPSVLIELEGHGREDLFDGIDLSRSVGWFTARYPVSLAAQSDPGAAIKAVKESLRAVPNKGIGWGLLEAQGNAAVRALPQPQVCFNYLGQLDGSFGGLFALAPEEPGRSVSALARRSHWLNVNGIVAHESLKLTWTYSPAIHTRQQIETLAQAYLAALEGLIDHCLTTEGGVTPSDFPDIDIGQDDLDRFLEEIL